MQHKCWTNYLTFDLIDIRIGGPVNCWLWVSPQKRHACFVQCGAGWGWMAEESENYCASERATQLLLLLFPVCAQEKHSCCQSFWNWLIVLLSPQGWTLFPSQFCLDIYCKLLFSPFSIGQVEKRHLVLGSDKFICLWEDSVIKYWNIIWIVWLDCAIWPVKAKEMWVTVSLPHPFLERPKVRLTSHSYAVMSLFEDHGAFRSI